MIVARRRLFWKIYLTLLASLVAAVIFMAGFFWFIAEAQRETARPSPFAQTDVSRYDADGKLAAARGTPITLDDFRAHRHWGPGRIMRLNLPDGGFVLTRFGRPGPWRAWRFVFALFLIAGFVGLAAYPVTALLTRRLEALRSGVARWGAAPGPVHLDDRGQDEVALLARTFNDTAARLDALITSQKALLANASHELRSPLARLRVAVEVGRDDAKSKAEIVQNLAEMDELVDELLLSSRLDHPDVRQDRRERVDLLGLAAEEAARTGAVVNGTPVEIMGDPVLLRRLIRNLLENGKRHGRPPVEIGVWHQDGAATLIVGDAGPGVPAADRERIFEPFYRPAGSGEAAGGWGLGLALVRQIAARHGGSVTCESGPNGSSRFVARMGG